MIHLEGGGSRRSVVLSRRVWKGHLKRCGSRWLVEERLEGGGGLEDEWF